jgi:hypothetical protein
MDAPMVRHDVEEWNQLTTRPLIGWSEDELNRFTALTTRLVLAAVNRFPSAVEPLLTLKEMTLKVMRVLVGLLPPPAPSPRELGDLWCQCAAHLEVLRRLAETPESVTPRQATGRRGHSPAALAYALELHRTHPEMTAKELLGHCRRRFPGRDLPGNAKAFAAWLRRGRASTN